ncbi:AraC family transcriptional regulator [Marinicrinis sediminis]|uniref:AraC family transcriptional regulator n=1 Tax=Marinicrinis sediminis TaxID=1652465 RepID=A0ABW5R5S4_9BACL
MTLWEPGIDTTNIFMKYMDDQPHPTQLHSHPNYEIYYFHRGQCSYLIGDQLYELKEGDLIIMHGLTLHCANIDPDQPYVRSVIHFNSTYVEDAIRAPFSLDVLMPFKQHRNARFRLTSEQQSELLPLLEKMNACNSQQDAVSRQRFHLAFFELLTLIYRFSDGHEQGDESRYSSVGLKQVQAIISYVEEMYREDIHLDDLAQALHVNKYYLSKRFKETTSLTIFEYLYQRRVNQAKILLHLNPELSITQISYEVGFKHPAHFSRVFKSLSGQTPQAYRKQPE